jgi:hypothetical protein
VSLRFGAGADGVRKCPGDRRLESGAPKGAHRFQIRPEAAGPGKAAPGLEREASLKVASTDPFALHPSSLRVRTTHFHFLEPPGSFDKAGKPRSPAPSGATARQSRPVSSLSPVGVLARARFGVAVAVALPRRISRTPVRLNQVAHQGDPPLFGARRDLVARIDDETEGRLLLHQPLQNFGFEEFEGNLGPPQVG